MIKFLKEERKYFREIWSRIKNRNFSGNEGLEIKNSLFTTMTSLVTKVGALIFTIILARLLVPELFGLYSLVLAVIMIFLFFSDLGIGASIVRFVSRELGKGNESKAKSYALYFLKIKIILITITTFVLLISAKYLAENFFEKPLFFGLIAGALYLFLIGVSEIMEALLASTNNFKNIFWKQTLFQIFRIIFVPFLIIIGINYSLSGEKNISLIILGLAGACLVSTLVVYILSRKKFCFLKYKTRKLTKKDKRKTRKFLITMPSLAISGLFFGEIDILILGYFVLSEFVGYYRAVLSLGGSVIGLLAFSGALLPVFSKLTKKQIERDFKKFLYVTLFFSGILMIFVLIFAPTIIQLIYGERYLASSNLLRIFSLIIISCPLISLYETYFISQGKPELIAKLLMYSTILNVALTFFFIRFFLEFGHLQAVYGAVIASIISSYVVLVGLMFSKLKNGIQEKSE